MIAVRRKHIPRERGRKLLGQADEVDRMLSGLISSLRAVEEQPAASQS